MLYYLPYPLYLIGLSLFTELIVLIVQFLAPLAVNSISIRLFTLCSSLCYVVCWNYFLGVTSGKLEFLFTHYFTGECMLALSKSVIFVA